MTRYAIYEKRIKHPGGCYVIPAVKALEFIYPKRLGAYCADDGSLWTELESNYLFERKQDALNQRDEIIREIISA